jgi:PAS domain S-box-containing protein
MLLRRSPVWAYLIAVAGTALTMAVRAVTHGPPEILLASLAFMFSVLLAAMAGGWKPGLFATGLNVTGSIFFFTRPYYTFRVSDPRDIVPLLVYLASGVAISLLCEALHVAWRRIEQRQRRLEKEIAERRRAELSEQEQSERLRVTLASIGDAVITTDSHGSITYLNGVAENLTGWKLAEARAQSLETVFRIINEQTRATVESPVSKALREGLIVGLANHTVLIARNGVERPIDDSAAPIRDKNGHIVGIVMIFRDVTERRQAEKVLKETDRRKDEFLATLAHELRNPLAPIRNALEIIRVAGEDQQVVHEARCTMERQLKQMIRLVDDLLDVSRITRGTIELRKERVDLATVVRSAVETSQPLFDQVGQKLTVTLPREPVFVDADVTRLSQVFANLLNNAAKYTEPGGRINLTVKPEGANVVVSVKDNGIGIPAPMLAGIFDMFAQVDRSLERAHGGLGIGLTIVKRLIEMHGGTVEAHSEGYGCGTEFVVRQPIAAAPVKEEKSAQDSDKAIPTIPRCRILVVDDNKDAASSLALLLKIFGHDTCMAHDGQNALDLATTFIPEIVLLDIGMPKMSGYEVCRQLRKQPAAADALIVAVTGWGQDEDRRKSEEAEFDAHMVKPVEPRALMKLLIELQELKSSPARRLSRTPDVGLSSAGGASQKVDAGSSEL